MSNLISDLVHTLIFFVGRSPHSHCEYFSGKNWTLCIQNKCFENKNTQNRWKKFGKLEVKNMIQSSGKERLYWFFDGVYYMEVWPTMRIHTKKRNMCTHFGREKHTRFCVYCKVNKGDEQISNVIAKTGDGNESYSEWPKSEQKIHCQNA